MKNQFQFKSMLIRCNHVEPSIASTIRRKQFAQLIAHTSGKLSINAPLLLAGDFNIKEDRFEVEEQ